MVSVNEHAATPWGPRAAAQVVPGGAGVQGEVQKGTEEEEDLLLQRL